MPAETFADRLTRLVRSAGMTEADLASVLGVSENQARRVLAGTTQTLKLDAALRLCRRLGVSPWALAGESEPLTPPASADAGTGSPSETAELRESLATLHEAVATALEVIAPHLTGLSSREAEQLRAAMRRLAS